MQEKYLPNTRETAIAWVNEECGEVVQMIGKIGRFGLDGKHPEHRWSPTNREMLLSELDDLEVAIARVRAFLGPGPEKEKVG